MFYKKLLIIFVLTSLDNVVSRNITTRGNTQAAADTLVGALIDKKFAQITDNVADYENKAINAAISLVKSQDNERELNRKLKRAKSESDIKKLEGKLSKAKEKVEEASKNWSNYLQAYISSVETSNRFNKGNNSRINFGSGAITSSYGATQIVADTSPGSWWGKKKAGWTDSFAKMQKLEESKISELTKLNRDLLKAQQKNSQEKISILEDEISDMNESLTSLKDKANAITQVRRGASNINSSTITINH